MEIIKKGTFGANGKTYNVYVVKSPDHWYFTVAFDLVAFDADPLWGCFDKSSVHIYRGCAFNFDKFPIQNGLELAIRDANKLNPVWEF